MKTTISFFSIMLFAIYISSKEIFTYATFLKLSLYIFF